MSFEECVILRHPECNYYQDFELDSGEVVGHISQIVYFCGHLPVCKKFNNEQAFIIAKNNVEKYYSVVGITEEMNNTLKVMENVLPQFFSGILQMYQNDKTKVNENHLKPAISGEVKLLLRTNFTFEIQFYEFCKERLKRQLTSLKL